MGAMSGNLSLKAENSAATRSKGPAANQESRLLFFDEATLVERVGVDLVPPPIKKLGILLQADSPGDKARAISAMGTGLVHDSDGRIRLYYTGYSSGEPKSGICVAESEDGLHWRKPLLGQMRIDGADTNRLQIEGLPDQVKAVQPSLVRLPDGRWRMYFWAGRSKPRVLRYVAAESSDGLRWKVVNFEAPCLLHLLELSPIYSWAWMDGPDAYKTWRSLGGTDESQYLQMKRLCSNDATHTYADLQGGFEMFSVWSVPNRPGSGRRIEPDNSKQQVRCIHRRTSDDGLKWSDPELILVPDGEDSWDQQFYYLAQHRLQNLRVGFLGSYRIVNDDMNIEFVYSADGRRWKRPMRGAWLPRGPKGSSDSTRVYMPSHLLDRGDHWLALYTGMNTNHGGIRELGAPSIPDSIHGAEIQRHRFAGLSSRSSLTARIRTIPFILPGPAIRVDAAIAGELRAELCNAFGQPLAGLSLADCVPLTGDSQQHELLWKNATFSDYTYNAVSLRLEWQQGVVYGVFSPTAGASL